MNVAGGDRGFITFGTNATDCNVDPYRSYFRVPTAAPTANTLVPATGAGEYYEFTIPVQVPFAPTGVPTFYYLNGQMLSGLGNPDYMQDAVIALEFHTTP